MSKLNDIFDQLAKDIYAGKIKHGQVSPDMIRATALKIFDGVKKGFDGNVTPNKYNIDQYTTLRKMRENVFVFSGFKNYHQLKEMSMLLTDNNGNIRSFDDFYKDVKQVNETYNKHYLQAEYDHAISTGIMAAKWDKIKAEADLFPMLRYRALHDGRTRREHLDLDGATYPIGDDFWKTYYPPNGWRCRCDVDQVEKQAIKEPKSFPVLQPMFRNNVGIDGVVFSENHPYFKALKSENNKETVANIKSVTADIIKNVDYDTLKTNPAFVATMKAVEYLKKEFPDLDIEELASIRLYTGNFFKTLNNELRTKKATGYNRIFEQILNRALDKLPTEKGKLNLFRGTQLKKHQITKYKNAWKNKGIVSEFAFTSASLDLDIALDFAQSKITNESVNVLFFIHNTKKAKNIQKLAILDEKELLYKSKSKFNVTDYEYDKYTKIYYIALSEYE